MDYKKALEIFEIKNLKQITKEELKKKYYKLCLTYHPDKNIDSDTKE
jgi:DnaJ-class molecular chaperone